MSGACRAGPKTELTCLMQVSFVLLYLLQYNWALGTHVRVKDASRTEFFGPGQALLNATEHSANVSTDCLGTVTAVQPMQYSHYGSHAACSDTDELVTGVCCLVPLATLSCLQA